MADPHMKDCVIVVTGAGLGQAEPALGQRVLGNYFRALAEMGMQPQAICLYTGGVKMVADDSPVLEPLRALAAGGVPVIACRTCLEHYGLLDRVAVGEIGTMAQVIELQAAAGKVVTL
ncbi:MAG: DsrE family protein [Burkholderiales bacterium]|jgi:intracellular sulfur oxidation DsrE/DsrF family protein|nr:DsrE family protein [Burkholderiales bacterium]MCA3215823.1 DsrE family protein [Burkholderiales bacterium]MCA3224612.1 DsrE family protein [Burkholderiales bacterium]MCE2643992.1 DsrE family protein [Burkholderiaceae bacterium]